ncbi:MAG: undecaprenyldiphospho-muramoylpentapeptide beta-N-acetylglucosaminyltransferase [Candidatus Accumulibacter sp.]|jgi:UDP-N-acetylglucosamine--N-acetylmuramyl-(pentapeptide) pyrophosphoryl-undecaprenol N-acetylglucosamine transferase|nr:undecaprenyldiphospho-muramoylpentapeptide beta-N-acetylglucosaminyltransferase [Accumulibacter sp.]
MSRTLLVMAGGTGGHVFPGLAVADLLRDRGWRIVWMGNPDSFEARTAPARGYEMAWIRFAALRGKGLSRKLLLPFNLLSGLWQAFREIRRARPDVVLGMGGYVSFPGGVVAALLGRPLVIHEQNSIAGLANRALARVADRILCGFPDALPKSRHVGNPVRPEIAGLPEPSARYGARGAEPLRLLVLGGSLGAAAINDAVPRGLALISEAERPSVRHQAGEKHLATLEANYAAAGVRADCRAFIPDMAEAYAWADLALCRAGASTVAELAAAGVASALVPYPSAVDDHQSGNAKFLARAGAAFLLPQSEMSAESVAALIRGCARERLLGMAEKARALAKPAAAAEVARACEEVCGP